MEYWFYHLEHVTLESSLPTLLEKTRERGWRARLQFKTEAAMAEMDRFLWTYKQDSFLTHGRDDAPMSEHQSILLSLSENMSIANPPYDIVFLIEGAEPGDLTGVKRLITMVDSRDETGRSIARERWKTVKANGHDVSYWRQNQQGRWTKQ